MYVWYYLHVKWCKKEKWTLSYLLSNLGHLFLNMPSSPTSQFCLHKKPTSPRCTQTLPLTVDRDLRHHPPTLGPAGSIIHSHWPPPLPSNPAVNDHHCHHITTLQGEFHSQCEDGVVRRICLFIIPILPPLPLLPFCCCRRCLQQLPLPLSSSRTCGVSLNMFIVQRAARAQKARVGEQRLRTAMPMSPIPQIPAFPPGMHQHLWLWYLCCPPPLFKRFVHARITYHNTRFFHKVSSGASVDHVKECSHCTFKAVGDKRLVAAEHYASKLCTDNEAS